jgi:hypothetical protein
MEEESTPSVAEPDAAKTQLNTPSETASNAAAEEGGASQQPAVVSPSSSANSAAASEPKSAAELKAEGDALFRDGALRDAFSRYNAALTGENPESALEELSILSNAGLCALKMGEWEEVRSISERMCQYASAEGSGIFVEKALYRLCLYHHNRGPGGAADFATSLERLVLSADATAGELQLIHRVPQSSPIFAAVRTAAMQRYNSRKKAQRAAPSIFARLFDAITCGCCSSRGGGKNGAATPASQAKGNNAAAAAAAASARAAAAISQSDAAAKDDATKKSE